MTRVGLVGCSSTKLKRPAPARELYTSQLFRKASAYAELTCDRWYVLSAMHGLVSPDTVLGPYDMRLGTADAAPVHDWAWVVRGQLFRELEGVPDVELVILAGDQYQTVIRPSFWPYEIPMKGLGIGQQLGFLTRELTRA